VKNILSCAVPALEIEFENVAKEIGALKNARTFWYPSSAFDLRPLSYFHKGIVEEKREGAPQVELFVYNSLMTPEFTQLTQTYEEVNHEGIEIFNDGKTEIRITQFIPLKLNRAKIKKHVSSEYFHFASQYASGEPKIDAGLMKFKVTSNKFGTNEPRLLFVEMENHNFANTIVMGGHVKPEYFCTVRDGCGFGGNNSCVNEIKHLAASRPGSGFFDFFKPKFWITDHFVLNGRRIEHTVVNAKTPIKMKKLQEFIGWQGYGIASLYSVTYP